MRNGVLVPAQVERSKEVETARKLRWETILLYEGKTSKAVLILLQGNWVRLAGEPTGSREGEGCEEERKR